MYRKTKTIFAIKD